MDSLSEEIGALERMEAEISPILTEGVAGEGNTGAGSRSVSRATIRRGMMAGTGILAATLVMACIVARPTRQNLKNSDPESTVRLNLLSSAVQVASTLAESVKATSDTMEQVRDNYHNMKGMYKEISESGGELLDTKDDLIESINHPMEKRAKIMKALKHMNATQRAHLKQRIMKKLNITSFKELRPRESLHDGNECEDDEELHAGLCYKKCGLLTGGSYPLRTTAWSCCSKANVSDCSSYTTKTSMKICGGFGVSGDASGNGCPHSPGGCLKDEELWAGTCYKMCSLLTYSQLPHRAAPATCCKVKTWLSFLDFENCNTDDEYNRGGGMGDNDTATPGSPHLPLVAVTEELGNDLGHDLSKVGEELGKDMDDAGEELGKDLNDGLDEVEEELGNTSMPGALANITKNITKKLGGGGGGNRTPLSAELVQLVE